MAPKKPKSPKKAKEASIADPGKMAEIKAKEKKKEAAKPGSEKVGKEGEKEKFWVEFKLLDAGGNAVKDAEKCNLTLSDEKGKKEKTGSMNKGVIREENIEQGKTVTIQLVNRYDCEWEFVRVEDAK
jgi:hypothetical protein